MSNRITPELLQAAYSFVAFKPITGMFYSQFIKNPQGLCGCPVTAIACYLEKIKVPPQEDVIALNVGSWAIDVLEKHGYNSNYITCFWTAIDGGTQNEFGLDAVQEAFDDANACLNIMGCQV